MLILDLYAINHGGESGRSICDVYPKELELKAEHQIDHAKFLNLDINIKEGVYNRYKLFEKIDSFPFLIVKMAHIKNNISIYFLFSNRGWAFKDFWLNYMPQGLYTYR